MCDSWAAAFHRFAVDGKALCLRYGRAVWGQAGGGFVGQRYARHTAPERARRQCTREARGTAGREHVVRTGDVVAEGGGTHLADEDAARPRQALDLVFGLVADQLD